MYLCFFYLINWLTKGVVFCGKYVISAEMLSREPQLPPPVRAMWRGLYWLTALANGWCTEKQREFGWRGVLSRAAVLSWSTAANEFMLCLCYSLGAWHPGMQQGGQASTCIMLNELVLGFLPSEKVGMGKNYKQCLLFCSPMAKVKL